MSKPIKEKTQGLLRQQAIVATREAAKDDNVSVHADALALVSQPDLMFVNAAKLLTFTKTELVVSVTRMLPSRGDTLTCSAGGGD